MRHSKNKIKKNSKITIFYEIFAILYEKTSNYNKKLG